MSKFILWLKKKLHTHDYYKPIISRYVSFETRDIIYECKCGDRKCFKVYRNYYTDKVGFGINTSSISHKDFIKYLNK